MTKTEVDAMLSKLYQTVSDIKTSNEDFKKLINEQVSSLKTQVSNKHMPLYFEKDILSTVQSGFSDCLKNVLTDSYNSPLKKLIALVIEGHSDELKGLISDSFSSVIRTDDFKSSIKTAFSHKVAKTIISNNDGLFDKVSNELKNDSLFRSKMVLAVSKVVEECLNERKAV